MNEQLFLVPKLLRVEDNLKNMLLHSVSLVLVLQYTMRKHTGKYAVAGGSKWGTQFLSIPTFLPAWAWRGKPQKTESRVLNRDESI